jgi:hypothetical protein
VTINFVEIIDLLIIPISVQERMRISWGHRIVLLVQLGSSLEEQGATLLHNVRLARLAQWLPSKDPTTVTRALLGRGPAMG